MKATQVMTKQAFSSLALLCLLLTSCGGPASTTGSSTTESPGDGSTGEQEAKTAPEYELKEADQTYLWDLEHHSNLLGKHGFGRIKRAMLALDSPAILSMLSDNFVGRSVANGDVIAIDEGTVFGRRERAQNDSFRELTREEFAELLLLHRKSFADEPVVKFGVKTIEPETRDDLDSTWTARLQIRMMGQASDGGRREITMICRFEFQRPTQANMEGPGWLYAADIEQVAETQANTPLFRDLKGHGVNVAELHDNWESPRTLQSTGGVFACDYNRDGCPDLFVTDVNHAAITLYQGLPDGGLLDVTQQVNLGPLRRKKVVPDCSFVDVDGDGWQDLVISDGAIWKNEAGQRFINVSESSNLSALTKQFGSASIAIADFDRDGRVDLYFSRGGGRPTSWLEDTMRSPNGNQLLRNLGGWRFEDVTETTGTRGDARSCFTSSWLDANNDGWPDLYLINEFGDGVLLVNQEGVAFRKTDADKETADFGSMGLATGDIDNDGFIDIYLASKYSKAGSRIMNNLPEGFYPDDVVRKLHRLISGSELYQNEGNLAFQAKGQEYQVHDVGWAWGPTLADFNNDGWLDIYAPAGYISRDRNKPDG